MERITYNPRTKQEWLILRATDLTSTEIPALFNLSPYLTSFELWHRKKDASIVEIEENERMKWGTRLEETIARGIMEDNGWIGRPKKEYISIKDLRIGCSFDFECSLPGDEDNRWLLEIKNVDSLAYKDGWLVDGDSVEAPPHIEMQVQHQMLVSGLNKAYIGALIGGNKVVLIERKADEKIHQAILRKSAQFWDSINKNQQPSPDFKRDAEFICKLYNYAEPGKVLEVDPDSTVEELVNNYRLIGIRLKTDKENQDAIKANIISLIGDAEKVIGDGFTISAGVVGEAEISYVRKAYRSFRIFSKKSKENSNG